MSLLTCKSNSIIPSIEGLIFVCLAFCVVMCPVRASYASVKTAGLQPALEQGSVRDIHFVDVQGLRNFYTANAFEPIWVRSGRRSDVRKARILHDVLRNSWIHGFNPYKYHLSEIESLLTQNDEQSLYGLELILSDAVIRYVRDLSAMRVDPSMVSRTIQNIQKQPVTEETLAFLADHSSPQKALTHFEPKGTFYALLQAELIDLVRNESYKIDANNPINFSGLIKPGQTHPSLPLLRHRLGGEGSSDYYDDNFAAIVMSFQRENGLEADGIIGPITVDILNITPEQRIERILVNMERLRWVSRDKPERYILVNVPSARLWAMEQGRVALDMPVVVGREGRETNSFISNITGVRFNPNWTLPPTIKREDYLPNLKRDPYYASKRGIKILDGYGKNASVIDPGTMDWDAMTWERFQHVRMIQDSGDGNPLGHMRVLMENPYNIYLHDTNTRHYFQRNDRFLSSGCVRVENPEALSHFIFAGNPDWSQEQYDAILRSQKLREVPTENPVPVFILYQTVWMGPTGKIVYGSDIYGWDQDLIQHMRENKLFYIPDFSKSDVQGTETFVNQQRDKDEDKNDLNSLNQGVARFRVNE